MDAVEVASDNAPPQDEDDTQPWYSTAKDNLLPPTSVPPKGVWKAVRRARYEQPPPPPPSLPPPSPPPPSPSPPSPPPPPVRT